MIEQSAHITITRCHFLLKIALLIILAATMFIAGMGQQKPSCKIKLYRDLDTDYLVKVCVVEIENVQGN